MYYAMLSKTKYLLVFTLSLYAQNIGAMLHKQAIKTCLQRMPLQKMMKNLPSNKCSLWIERKGSPSAGEKASDALLGAAAGLVAIPCGFATGGILLAAPYYLADTKKDVMDVYRDGARLGAVIGGVTASFIAGGPVGLAAFSTLMVSCYAIGKINNN